MPKLYDCFTFFNELDILDIRLAELAGVVDYFVLAEATRGFTGKPKPLHYADNAARYGAYRHKIIHVVVDDLPADAPDAWRREYFQRNAIARGLGGAAEDDVIMLSDADEIPRASVIRSLRDSNATRGAATFLAQDQFCFRMNLKAENFTWLKGTRLIAKKHLHNPQDFRALRLRPRKKAYQALIDPLRLRADLFRHAGALLTPRVIADAGWHFGYMGGNESVRLKVQSFAHQELNTDDMLSDAYIDGRIASGQFFNDGLGMKLRAVPLDASFPAYLQENAARYASHYYHAPK
jgi:beta-1,4-mannosyl-glycoprotein beta-1,4-N-acetylglucosaminyltransferase